MGDPHYPSVDIGFILSHVKASNKLTKNGIIKVGATTTIITEGNQAIYKRSTLLRELEKGQICLEQATAIALKFSFLGALLEWLELNRKWKEGAYIK